MLEGEVRGTNEDQVANGLLRLGSSDFILKTRTSPLRPPSNRHRVTITHAPLTTWVIATP